MELVLTSKQLIDIGLGSPVREVNWIEIDDYSLRKLEDRASKASIVLEEV